MFNTLGNKINSFSAQNGHEFEYWMFNVAGIDFDIMDEIFRTFRGHPSTIAWFRKQLLHEVRTKFES